MLFPERLAIFKARRQLRDNRRAERVVA